MQSASTALEATQIKSSDAAKLTGLAWRANQAVSQTVRDLQGASQVATDVTNITNQVTDAADQAVDQAARGRPAKVFDVSGHRTKMELSGQVAELAAAKTFIAKVEPAEPNLAASCVPLAALKAPSVSMPTSSRVGVLRKGLKPRAGRSPLVLFVK